MLHLIAKPPQKKKGKKLLEQIKAKLQEGNEAFELHFTRSIDSGAQIARELTQKGETKLVVIGGDGMVNDVLSGMENPALCELGIIPAGTGNDFASCLGMPKGIAALDAILQGKAEPVDYIQCTDGRRSMNIAGLGIDVDILERCYRMKHFRAKTKYFFSLLMSLTKYKGVNIRVKVNGEEKEYLALIAAVCNGNQFGGGIKMCPPACPNDGKLELVVVDQPKRRKILGALIKLMKGKVLSLPFAHRFTCDEAEIVPIEPCFAQYDGELYQTESLNATLVAGQLKLFYPQKA